jgi:DNA-binding beta-propeller fold protein YncE
MKVRTLASIVALLLAGLAGAASAQDAKSDAKSGPPQLTFHVTPNFLKLPDNFYMAEVVGVTLNSQGHIFVVNRGPHPLVEFDNDGSFIRSIADGFPLFEGPHNARVDAHDNLWYIDAGADLVVEFDKDRRIQMVLGRRPEPWTWQTHVVEHAIPAPTSFYQPTDVTWGADGSIFVSDGYGNSRIAKFDKDGNLVKHWGERGTGPGDFNTPHSIVSDAQGNLYVADRGNSRIQVFDSDGNFKQEFRIGGPPWSICITPGPNQVMFVGSVGHVYKVGLDGKVLGVMGKFGRVPGMFDWVHGIACPDEHTVYAAEELSWRLDRLTVE